MKHNKLLLVSLLVVLAVILSACGPSANSQEAKGAGGVEKQQALYIQYQPKPWFDWSLERSLMIQLYVARNTSLSTFSYHYNDYLGIIGWSCDSIGMPIPGGTQLTNPESADYYSNGAGYVVLPQAEPNGLYSPDTSAGTYVMCVNDDGTVSPEYHEFNVEAATIKYVTVNGELIKADGMIESLRIDPNNHSVNYKTAPDGSSPVINLP